MEGHQNIGQRKAINGVDYLDLARGEYVDKHHTSQFHNYLLNRKTRIF